MNAKYKQIFINPEEDYELIEKANLLAQKENIGITRDRELCSVIVKNDDVIAANWISWDFENYEFDVVVDHNFQGQKIGSLLINQSIEQFSDYKEMNEYAEIKLFVVNDIMKKALEKRGFEVTTNLSDKSWIMKEKNEIENILNKKNQNKIKQNKMRLS